MNEHLPPPRRPIPAHEQSAMREQLRHEMGGRSQPARPRLFAPALAAAATMAVVAAGGYVALGGGSESPPRTGFASDVTATATPSEDECDIEPRDEAGQGQSDTTTLEPDLSSVTPDQAVAPPDGSGPPGPLGDVVALEPDDSIVGPDGTVVAPPGADQDNDFPEEDAAEIRCKTITLPVDPGPPTSNAVEIPGPVFERCDELVQERFHDAGTTTGRLAIENGSVRTAVLTDGPTTYLCHVGPDIEEVSKRESQKAGTHLWAGGRLPQDATGITRATADGEQAHAAVVSDGWWALQAVEDQPIHGDWITLTHSSGGVYGLSGSGELCDEDDPNC